MTHAQKTTDRGRIIGRGLVTASLLALAACASSETPDTADVAEVTQPIETGETVRSALGKITLEATAEGQDVLGVQVNDERGIVNLHYSGPADRYVVCDTAAWLVPGGGVVNVNLSENAAFETIDNKGDPVSIERWVRLDALSNVVVRNDQRQLEVEPRIRYIVSMVTEVYNLNERIGHKAERLEFESGGGAVTSTGHRCKSTGVLEKLAPTAVS